MKMYLVEAHGEKRHRYGHSTVGAAEFSSLSQACAAADLTWANKPGLKSVLVRDSNDNVVYGLSYGSRFKRRVG